MVAGPSPEEVRRHNLGALLRLVHRHGAMTRAQLTARLGLNRSTIGALTADLAAADLVAEQAPRETGRAGRPSLVVSPRLEAVYAYALTIEADQLQAARVGLGGAVLDRRAAPRPRHPAPAMAEPFAGLIAEIGSAAPRDARCIGVGVAVDPGARTAPAAVDPAPGPGVERWAESLRAVLAPVLPADSPVLVGAVADLAALAEAARGVAVGCDDLVYLSGGWGISAGIIAGGRPLAGYGGAAGQVGHMVVHPDGRRCGCGSRGCWETEVGEQALLSAAGRGRATGRAAVRAVVDAAARGDAGAQAAVRQVGDWLGLGVGNLVNIFNPELVIFGGTLRDIYLAAAAPLRSRLNTVGLSGNLARLRLRTPALGDDAALIGAAELAFERLLADPLGVSGPRG